MSDDAYERLADALDRLPNGFPRSGTDLEIRILQRICSPDEAALAAALTGTPETVEAIAARVGGPNRAVGKVLMRLVRRGIAWPEKVDGAIRYRLAPFIVGIYESQAELMDHELAHLIEDYLASGGARGIMGPRPALHRVMPADRTVKSEEILPYDDVRALLVGKRTFHVGDCICRLQQERVGETCPFPKRVCLSFSDAERAPRPGDVSQAEALALLEMTEQVGLVHTVSNVVEGVGYVCNCCGCCCGILRGINDWGIAGSVASAAYVAVIDADACLDCGTCVERCQVGAISEGDGHSVVDRDRCIGCGLCVSGCPNDVARLERCPDSDIVRPPVDYAEWERLRLAGRASPAGG